jgi:hypothetical protein
MIAFLRWVIGLTVMLGGVYVLLATIGFVPTPYTCLTMTHDKISGLLGYDFEIGETDCSTLGEDASISVLVSKAGQTKEALLFKYDPAGVTLPIITPLNDHTIKISVPRISIVMFRRDSWENLSVVYSIGSIDHPNPDIEKRR